ncbi:MAG: TonB-dependent receptor family protein [Bacteroides sp.]|nr:TonB-dependent receptor family protein [Bacteroides sp.]
MKRSILLLLLCSLSALLNAQKLTGKLIDENNQPVAYANVVLLSLPDSTFLQGAISDEQGAFSLPAADNSAKILQISCIGYKKLNHPCTSGALGTLNLTNDAITLNETVITGRRPVYRLKGSSLTTTVQNTLLSTLGTGNDVLKRIPGIRMDHEKNVEVFGKGTPLIYINGRLVRDNSELDQLNSNDIEKVELITNPGAEYDAEVKAVLRIKTVKPVGEGLGGFVRAAASYASAATHTEMLNLNYRKGDWDIFGQLMNVDQYMKQNEDIELDVKGTDHWHLNNLTRAEGKHLRGIAAQGGINYTINENHSLGANYQLQRFPYSGTLNASQDFEVMRNDALFDRIKADFSMDKRKTVHKVNFYYFGKVNEKLSIDFNADYLSGKNSDKTINRETSEEQEDRQVNSLGKAEYDLYAGKLIFSYPLGKGQLNFGGEASRTNHHDSYRNEQEIVPSNENETNETKFAGFLAWQAKLGKLSLNAGLRYEHTSFDYYENGKKQSDQCRVYNNVYPNISLSLPSGNSHHSLSYTAKTMRPRYEQLNGNVQYSNRYMYKQGNPILRPETQHDITYQYGYRFLNMSVSYQYIKNYISATRELYADDGSISISRDLNADKNQRLNIMLSVSPEIGLWHPSFNVYFTQQFFKTEFQQDMMSFNNPVASFTLNNDFTLPGGFVFSLTGDYHTAGNEGPVKTLSSGALNIGLRKSWMDGRLQVNLDGSDLLDTYRRGGILYSPSCEHAYTDTYNSRSVSLSVLYRFNATRSKYKGTGAANDEIRRL